MTGFLLLLVGCDWPSHVYEPYENADLWRPTSQSEATTGNPQRTGDSAGYDTQPTTLVDTVVAEALAVRTFPCLDPSERDNAGPFQESRELLSIALDSDVDTMGLVVLDVNGDGWDDVWLAAPNGGDVYLFDGSEFIADAGSNVWGSADMSTARGGSVVDYDADGDLDLFVLRDGGVDRLFRNDGDGAWQEETEALFKVQDAGASRAALWTDSDSDGDLDLWVVNDDSGETPRLYQNNDGAFDLQEMEDWIADLEAFRDVTQLHAVDVVGDGQPELLSWHSASSDGVFARLWTRGASGLWTASGSPVATTRAALSVAPRHAAGQDGLDWFVGGAEGGWGIQSNGSKALTWSNVSLASWGIPVLGLDSVAVTGIYVGDLDHDGVQDVLWDRVPFSVGIDGFSWNEDRLYLMGEVPDARDQAQAFGLNGNQNGLGGGLVDINQDGWLDVVRRNVTGINTVQLSRCGNNPSLHVRLSWSGLNLNGLGSSVRLDVDGVQQTRWMQSDGPAGSATPPVVHFGVGAAGAKARSLRVTWPDGKVSHNSLDVVGGLAATSYEVVVYRTD